MQGIAREGSHEDLVFPCPPMSSQCHAGNQAQQDFEVNPMMNRERNLVSMVETVRLRKMKGAAESWTALHSNFKVNSTELWIAKCA